MKIKLRDIDGLLPIKLEDEDKSLIFSESYMLGHNIVLNVIGMREIELDEDALVDVISKTRWGMAIEWGKGKTIDSLTRDKLIAAEICKAVAKIVKKG